MNEILNKLIENGYEAYVVGGYVRDLLLNKSSFDIDICTNASIEKIKELFPNSKIYSEYYSCHFKSDIYSIEITSYREELDYKNNKPIKINYCNTLYEDLLRRDFTINAICLDVNNNIIDLINGVKDLNNKIIKVIGDTYTKLEEDNTRILRAIRFCSILDFKLDDNIEYFLKEKGYLISNLNNDYIKKELDIIFNNSSKNFFKIVDKYNLKQYLKIDYKNIVYTSYYGLWAQIDNNFNFTKEDKYIITSIKKILKKRNITKEDIYRYGEYICKEAAFILNIEIDSLIESMPIKSILDIDINVEELLKIIKKENINKTYKLLEKNILNDKVKNNKKDLIEFIKRVI